MGYQAIVTRYLGPTNHRGSRIVARASAGRVFIEYEPGKSSAANHKDAAFKLAAKFGWVGTWLEGELPGPHAESVFVLETNDTFLVEYTDSGLLAS